MALVLIVEDEADLAALLEFNLQQAGLETTLALNGREAFVHMAQRRPDMMIVDLMLPDISGIEICRRVRENPQWASLPVVMLTARSEEGDRLQGFESGADDYITKPFSPRELVMRVKAILRRINTANPPMELRLGLLRLDTGTHRAWVGDDELELTALEFKLLEYLMSAPGLVRSRERLLTDVWNVTSTLETRTVDTHVMRLREKLGGARQQLETVRGVGYRLTED